MVPETQQMDAPNAYLHTAEEFHVQEVEASDARYQVQYLQAEQVQTDVGASLDVG